MAKPHSPLSFLIRNDFPEPHLAYNPTEMGMDNEGSLKISAMEEEYKSYPSIFSFSSLVVRRPEQNIVILNWVEFSGKKTLHFAQLLI